MPASDVTVTGSFTADTYTLTYVVDGEVYKTFQFAYGEKLTAEAAPEKEGHTFSGWEGLPETMPASEVTVTGTFTVNTYHLIYMLDGAEYKRLEVAYGEKLTAEAAPEKEGHTFSGWEGLLKLCRRQMSPSLDHSQRTPTPLSICWMVRVQDFPVRFR